jgi:hypothetical protein
MGDEYRMEPWGSIKSHSFMAVFCLHRYPAIIGVTSGNCESLTSDGERLL